jgi:hypothetical protein
MGKSLTVLTLLASLAAVGAAWADEDCSVPMAQWQPREVVQRMAEAHGWTVRRIKIDDGCYEIDGRDADGRASEMTVDPATLTILAIEYKDEETRDADHGNHDRAPGREDDR